MRTRDGSGAGAIVTAIALLAIASADSSWGAPVRIFRTQSADAFGKGESDAVAIDASGVLALAPMAERIAEFEEPFAFTLVPYRGGFVVGTGSDGGVLAVDGKGKVRVVFDAEEAEIFALAAGDDGVLFAGSSPDGKVYRLVGEKSEIWFDPEETYIWAIAPSRDRKSLWVAAGAPGRLYRVTGKDAAETIWEGSTYVRSLLPMANGDLLFGTAGDGRLLRWHDGQVRTLHDSELTEVVALAAAPDGSVWIAMLASESSFVDLGARASGGDAAGDGTQAVVVVGDDSATGSRPIGATGPRSELLRLLPNGSVESVWSSTDESIFALAPDGEAVWVATGLDGKLYRVDPTRARVERKFDAKQLVGLLPGESGPTVLTTNGASLWKMVERRETKGAYTSAVLDALQAARFGVFRWQGAAPQGARVKASFRSGFSSEPDDTWTPWSAPREGSELDLGTLEPGRFVQYRLELEAGSGGSPRVATTELTYRQENLRPTIQSFAPLDPGQILVPAGFNPADQLYEPASPNRDGIFDTLKQTPPKPERQKTVWRRGWLTLKWEASDPNGDTLGASLAVRPESSPDGWLALEHEISESQYPFDATALPDGLYRFRLTVTDEPGNERPGAALEATRESEPVVVDQTPPELVSVVRREAALEVRATDAWSPLRDAEISVDGAAWRAAEPVDGLLDGKSESFRVDLPKGAQLALLRLTDAAWNVRTYDLLAEAKR